MGINTHSGSALAWPEHIQLEQLKILAENKPITIENETIELKSVELAERLSKDKHFNSEHEKFKSMLPGKGQIASKGKVLGLGKSYAIRHGECNNTQTCQYTFRTLTGTIGNVDPSKFTLEVKETEYQHNTAIKAEERKKLREDTAAAKAQKSGNQREDLILQPRVYNYYYGAALKFLDVNNNTPIDEIQKAYRKKSLTVHPDKVGHDEDFKELKNALDYVKLYRENLDEQKHIKASIDGQTRSNLYKGW